MAPYKRSRVFHNTKSVKNTEKVIAVGRCTTEKIARNPRSDHNDEHARRPDRPEQRNGRDGEEIQERFPASFLKQDQRHGRQKNTEQKNRIFHPARIGPHGGNQLGPRQDGAYLGHFRYLQAQPPYVQPTPRSIDFASEQKSHGEQYQRAQICDPGDALEKNAPEENRQARPAPSDMTTHANWRQKFCRTDSRRYSAEGPFVVL